jgi:hypothetical protein
MTQANPNYDTAISLIEFNTRIPTAYKLLLSAADGCVGLRAHDLQVPHLIHGIVGIFQALLGRLHRHVLDELTRQEVEEATRKRKPKSNMKVSKGSEHDKRVFTESASMLVRLLRELMTTPDLAKPIHCQLFKALFTVLLDHIGSTLATLIFADPEQTKHQGMVADPIGLEHVSHLDVDAALAAAALEAPYLIALLKSILDYLHKNEKKIPLRSRELLTGSREAIDNTLLHERVQKRLQDTLLRGIFGDDDDSFREAFTRDPSPETRIQVDEAIKEAAEEEDKGQWFIGQIWEILGWDMLSRKMEKMS